MHALTFWRPWPSVILGPTGPNPMGIPPKRVENRGYRPPRWAIGVDIAMHAGLHLDRESLEMVILGGYHIRDVAQPTGIVGVFRFTSSIEPYRVPRDVPRAQAEWWWNGNLEKPGDKDPHAWMMVNVRALREPIPCKGAQGFWTVPAEVEAEIARQIGETP